MMVAVSMAGSQFRLEGTQDHKNASSTAMAADAQIKPLPITRGDFEFISELGRGGMGIVYRAHQISLDRDVALKMILPGYLHDAEHLERFQQEAEAAAPDFGCKGAHRMGSMWMVCAKHEQAGHQGHH